MTELCHHVAATVFLVLLCAHAASAVPRNPRQEHGPDRGDARDPSVGEVVRADDEVRMRLYAAAVLEPGDRVLLGIEVRDGDFVAIEGRWIVAEIAAGEARLIRSGDLIGPQPEIGHVARIVSDDRPGGVEYMGGPDPTAAPDPGPAAPAFLEHPGAGGMSSSDGHPSWGATRPEVTLTVFCSFASPYCAMFTDMLDRVERRYGDRVRFVYRQWPMPEVHPEAWKAAEASLCAADQGRFRAMHDLMFEEQGSLDVPDLIDKAARIELDVGAFRECLATDRHSERVQEDVSAAMRMQLSGTPSLLVDGRALEDTPTVESLVEILERELAGRRVP